ncbi:MAG TPA: YggS family pyridoxal phosphate-dependent enzyme [Isosphaeraceae bacterium]
MDRKRLRENWETVRGRMAEAARRSGRPAGSVTLVAVTKRSPAAWLRPLVDLGAMDLGENYPQELWGKAATLADLPVRWHLIGHLQGNKARRTLPLVRLVHGVDSPRLLGALDARAAGMADPPSACLQVNVSGETTKHGWSPEALFGDAGLFAACRHLPIVGLMTMAALGTTAEAARPAFARLRALRDALRAETGLALNELSMGMSHDYEVAIEEGATLIRVGSALFEGVEG